MSKANAKPADSLKDDIAAFNQEMRQAARPGPGPLVPFVLGAVTALTTIGVTVLLFKS